MARTRKHDRMCAGKVTAQMRVYNSKQWKAARRQAMHVAEFVCEHPGCREVLSGPGQMPCPPPQTAASAMALAYEPLNQSCALSIASFK